MGASCSIDCYVKNPEGEIVESNLWKDLKLHFPSRNLAKKFYGAATDKSFVESAKSDKRIKFDRNGEITFNSLRKAIDLDIKEEQMLDDLNKRIGSGTMDYNKAVGKLIDFNTEERYNDDYMAMMVPSEEHPGKYDLSVVRRTTENEIELEKHLEDWNIIKNIVEVLQSKGVAVDFLLNGQKEYAGRYSTMNARKTADGLYNLIQIASGRNVAETLAEEAGHFAVGSLGDSPLVKRLEALISDPEVQREILGEEYESRDMGTSATREVAGDLVGKALIGMQRKNSPWAKLANRIADIAKSIYATFTGNDVMRAKLQAEQTAKRIARNFMSENFEGTVENALQMREELFHATHTNGKVFREITKHLDVAIAQLKALGRDNPILDDFKAMTSKVVAGRTQYVESDISGVALQGIAETLDLLRDQLGQGKGVTDLLDSIDLFNESNLYENMGTYANNLRTVRTFVNACDIILKEIEPYIATKVTHGQTTLVGDLGEVKLINSKGIRYTVNLKTVYNDLKTALVGEGGILESLKTKEFQLFLKFCEDIIGTKAVYRNARAIWNITENQKNENSSKTWLASESKLKEAYEKYVKRLEKKNSKYEKQGKDDKVEHVKSYKEWKKEKQRKTWVLTVGREELRLEDALTYLSTDISLFERYVDSMSNNADIIGQILDKATKLANKQADDNTNLVHEQLMNLHRRLDNIKGLDMEDLYEKDENEKFTGNIVSDLNWGKWEADFDKFYKERRKEFDKAWEDVSMTEIERTVQWERFFKSDYTAWMKENGFYDETLNRWIPTKSKSEYRSDSLKKLKDKHGDAFTDWYNDYLELKHYLDACLPEKSTTPVRLPQFKGTFTNIVANAGAWTSIKSGLADAFCESSEDTDFGSDMTYNSEEEMLYKSAVSNLKESINRLPLYGIRKLQNMGQLSTDIFGSTLAYAGMAFSYQAMSRIADAAEVGKDVLAERTVAGYREGDKRRLNWLRHKLGDGSNSRAFARYSKFVDKQIYGKTSSKTKIFNKVILEKVFNLLNRFGSFWFLGGNVAGATVNLGTGFIELFKEASVGENMNMKDFLAAHKDYWKCGGLSFLTYGSEFKNDKVSLFVRKFNTTGDAKRQQRQYDTRNPKYRRIANMLNRSVYLPYRIGDHYMHTIAYIAAARDQKLWHADGSKLSLYDALTKVSSVGAELRDLLKNTTKVDAMKADDRSLVDPSLLKKGANIDDFIALNALINKCEDVMNNQPITDKEKALLKKYKIKGDSRSKTTIDKMIKAADSMVKTKHSVGFVTNNEADMTLRLNGTYFLSKDAKEEYLRLQDLIRKVRNSNSGVVVGGEVTEEDRKALEEMGLDPQNGANTINKLESKANSLIWNIDRESELMDKVREIAIRMHGVYNNQDRGSMASNMVARLWLSMKGYAIGMIERRFGSNKYSIALGHDVEGSQNSTFKLLLARHTEMKASTKFLMGMRALAALPSGIFGMGLTSKKMQQELTDAGFSSNQVYNIQRAQYDRAALILLYVLQYLLSKYYKPDKDDDDDEEAEQEENAVQGRIYYLANRLLFEQNAFNTITGLRNESRSLLDLTPPAFAAGYDFIDLCKEIYGGIRYDYEELSDSEDKEDQELLKKYFQSKTVDFKYDKGDPKYEAHIRRNTPYVRTKYPYDAPWKSWDNYEYGTKVKR